MDHIITLLEQCTGFHWDAGNSEKNWINHSVLMPECEQLFFNEPLVVMDDEKHSQGEKRYYALGQTDEGRKLLIVFTVRNHLIRIISARDMSRKERTIYEKA